MSHTTPDAPSGQPADAPPDGDDIGRAAAAIAVAGVIAYPTEYCFGLGCHPRSSRALRRVLQLKSRSWQLGMIIIAAHPAQLSPYVDTRARLPWRRARAAWPSATTFLLPARRNVSPWLRGVHATIACRVSRHPVVIELCRRAGSAIVSTSANPHGTKPARSARQVHCLFPRHVFRNAIDVVIDRRVGSATSASTIIDAITGDVVRAGAPPWNTPRETLAESVR